ncbi:helix-turn-helix domain-containing protein [Actinomadura rugatobispora]|uniref:Helix-turn-helix transcriptional regulator n=1 Tax=Actinomadura rugatobispora TaxID=1994 RepID=A0ABW1A4T6_9ACTN|nr:helix-turn-helix transcriptional regulator [Actinomadura rugatobispora]
MASPTTASDPLIPRLLLGRRLRELREARTISRARAATAAGRSPSTITRIERGRTSTAPETLTALLTLYSVADDERATLLALADQTKHRPWWHDHRDAVPHHRRRYLSAEGTAWLVRCYSDRYLPDLLRTNDYARALGSDLDLLSQRRRILRRRPRPVNLWVVLDEAVLWRPVGDAATMRAQLEHLVELCWRPNVTIQIAAYNTCRRVAPDGPLTLIRFPQQNLPDMVTLESDGTYPTRPAEIEHHWHVFNTLVTEAAPPEHTPRLVEDALSEYRTREIGARF